MDKNANTISSSTSKETARSFLDATGATFLECPVEPTEQEIQDKVLEWKSMIGRGEQIQISPRWHTPAEYIEAAREVMGSIDLDPASCHIAQQAVKAR